jgi:mannose-6-phosphate isomerase-like protein (cupin superfamily)
MNTQKVIKELTSQYPGKTIVLNPEDRPTEILCEIDPSARHPAFSVAVAVIDRSTPHLHKMSTEKYEILKGTLTIFKDGEKNVLGVGDTIEIWPNEIHYATGNESWVKVTSRPGWTPEDHKLVED